MRGDFLNYIAYTCISLIMYKIISLFQSSQCPVPTTATYQESGVGIGTVMVCATLSGVIEGIQTPISIALATSNSTPGTELNK